MSPSFPKNHMSLICFIRASEGAGLISVETVIISFIRREELTSSSASYSLRTSRISASIVTTRVCTLTLLMGSTRAKNQRLRLMPASEGTSPLHARVRSFSLRRVFAHGFIFLTPVHSRAKLFNFRRRSVDAILFRHTQEAASALKTSETHR